MNDQELIKLALRFIADLNGCEWITGNGAGEVDMRQRAKGLHTKLANRVFRGDVANNFVPVYSSDAHRLAASGDY